MTPDKLLLTSGLLGVFVLLGGAYGVLFSYGSYRRRPGLVWVARACFVLQCAVTIAVVSLSPLWWWWKLFLGTSCTAYFFIPPLTMRYLIRLHHSTEQ